MNMPLNLESLIPEPAVQTGPTGGPAAAAGRQNQLKASSGASGKGARAPHTSERTFPKALENAQKVPGKSADERAGLEKILKKAASGLRLSDQEMAALMAAIEAQMRAMNAGVEGPFDNLLSGFEDLEKDFGLTASEGPFGAEDYEKTMIRLLSSLMEGVTEQLSEAALRTGAEATDAADAASQACNLAFGGKKPTGQEVSGQIAPHQKADAKRLLEEAEALKQLLAEKGAGLKALDGKDLAVTESSVRLSDTETAKSASFSADQSAHKVQKTAKEAAGSKDALLLARRGASEKGAYLPIGKEQDSAAEGLSAMPAASENDPSFDLKDKSQKAVDLTALASRRERAASHSRTLKEQAQSEADSEKAAKDMKPSDAGRQGQQTEFRVAGPHAGVEPQSQLQQRSEHSEVADQTPAASRIHGYEGLKAADQAAGASTENMPASNQGLRFAVAQQLSQGIAEAVRFSRNRAVLHLNPPELGRVRVTLSVTGSSHVNATFIAEHPDTRQIIESSMAQLREQLHQNGFSLGDLNVGLGARHDSGDSRGFGSALHQGQSNSAASDPGLRSQVSDRPPEGRMQAAGHQGMIHVVA